MANMSRKRVALLSVIVVLGITVAVLLVLSARGVRMRSETVVPLTPAQAWRFFEEPGNLAEWDRSVARVEPTTSEPVGLGYTFDTISPTQPGAPDGQRMSYRVVEFRPDQRARIDLVDSDMFEHAQWIMTLEPVTGGTRVVAEVDYAPKLRYFFLTPVLLLNRDALATDMEYLKARMEEYDAR